MDRIGIIGSLDSIKVGEGCGVVLGSGESGIFLEYAEMCTGGHLEVFRTHISDNVINQFHLVTEEADDLCEFLHRRLSDWILNSYSPDPLKRSQCVIDIGNFLGWDSIDDDPLTMSKGEFRARWFHFPQYGKVTTTGSFKPSTIVPEMAGVLHNLNKEEFLKLFGSKFPLVPSGPFKDPNHIWWDSHGLEAVNKIVDKLKHLAPEKYVFEVRHNSFGFWKKQTEETNLKQRGGE